MRYVIGDSARLVTPYRGYSWVTIIGYECGGYTMERHEFDAAYARICEVCGMKTQTELSAYLGIRQSSISDAKRRVAVPAAWLLTLLTREGVNPT